jgi:hypothetical protein
MVAFTGSKRTQDLTRLGGLSHDVANIVGGRGTENISQALSTLETLGAEAVGAIRRLLTMADEVDGGLGGGSRDQQKRDEVGELHDES